MKQKELLILKRGQFKVGKNIPKILDVLGRDNIDLFFVLSEFISMPKQARLRDIDVSFIFRDIFENMITERIITDTSPIDVFSQKMEGLRKEISGIIEFRARSENGKIGFHVFIKKPNWELEERIYNVYGDLLDRFPTFSFDLEVKELFS